MRLSDEIKLELMKYFRFQRSYNCVCSEGINNADVNAYNGTSLVEVEVKISKADFKKEFQTEVKLDNRWKIYKHRNYSEPHKHIMAGYIVPNRFYMCVPVKLAEWAADYLKDKNQKYGLLYYDTEKFNGHYHIFTKKPARNIHNEEQSNSRIYLDMSRRTSNELITAKENFLKNYRELEILKEGIIVNE